MAYTRDSIPDQTGRTVVVTGANGGLGLETAKALAAKGAHVVMAARDRAKAAAAVEEIRARRRAPQLEPVDLDLASLASVRAAAEQVLAEHPRLDVLVNNAGVMATPERRTADGFELQLGVNHLGHWALTALLMPALLAAPRARVVTVTSTAHHGGRPLDPDNPHLHGRYDTVEGVRAVEARELPLRPGARPRAAPGRPSGAVVIAHPGLSHTDLQVRTVREGGPGRSGLFWQWLAASTGMPPARGALPQLRAATDPEANGGELYGPRFVNNGPAVRLPVLRPGADAAIATLWAVSERETGIPMEV